MSSKEIEVVVVDGSVDMDDSDFPIPSNYYFVNSLGDYHFLITRSRAKATQYITDNYGKDFFKLRTMKIEKTKNELTVRGTATR